MIQFNFSDRSVQVPTSWEEVTVAHFVTEGFMAGNSLSLLAVLSGIPVRQLASTTEDLTTEFAKAVGFMKDNPMGWQGGPVPQYLKVMDTKCKVPLDIEMEMFGQKIMLAEAIASKDESYQAIPDAVAIYLAPQIFKDDWFDRVDEVRAKILNLPISSVYPIAAFFLTSLDSLQQDGKVS